MICWARDLLWKEGSWTHDGRRSRGIQDPLQLTLNTYRVLLTRGRDGFVILLPANPLADNTFDFLKQAGVIELTG
ncbi:MAG: DNA/RNA helicase domain-containing protein [Pirellulales bacterium]